MRPLRFLALVALLAFAGSASALDVPPKPTQWVNDYGANLLSSGETQQLNEKLEALHKQTGTQFLIMIFPSLEGEDALGYANRVTEQWKVKDDKALMLFVFLKERQTRIMTGYGLESVVTDAFASDVYRNTLAPRFREQQYAAGLNEAIDRLAKKIDPSWSPSAGSPGAIPSRVPPRAAARGESGGGFDIVMLLVLAFLFLFFILPMLRRGGCGGCFWPMWFLGGGGGGGITFGGGRGGGGGWGTGGSWGSGSSFGGGGAGGGW